MPQIAVVFAIVDTLLNFYIINTADQRFNRSKFREIPIKL